MGSATTVIPSLLLLLLCLTHATTDAEADADSVKVTVFYEALCPDSKKFIVGQLYPVWRILSDIMEVELNAFGKTKEIFPREFHCQHGERECAANQMLTCAKNVTTDPCITMNFTRCVMENLQGVPGGLLCANESGVEWPKVEECMESREGSRLQHMIGIEQSTLNPTLDYVPWILVNNVFTWEIQKEAERNLLRVVCNAYEGPRPIECTEEDA